MRRRLLCALPWSPLVAFWLWVRFLSGWFYASEVQTGLMMLSFCLVGIDLSIDQRKQARRQSTDC